MRTATILAIASLALTGCDRAPAPPPPESPHVIACGGEESAPDRITASVVRSETDSRSTTRPGSPAARLDWVIKISGRGYQADEAGLARLEAVFKELGAKDRTPTPPQLSERPLIIRADPDAPYELVQTLVERAARAGFYRFEIGSPLPSSSDTGPSSGR